MSASTAADPLYIFSGALGSCCHRISFIAFCCTTVFCGSDPGRFIRCSCPLPAARCFSWGCCSSGLGGVIDSCGRSPACGIIGSCWLSSRSLLSPACFSSTACCRSRLSRSTVSWSCLFVCSCCRRFRWNFAVTCSFDWSC